MGKGRGHMFLAMLCVAYCLPTGYETLLLQAEQSGLLSTLEGLGFTLSNIESLGLLSKAEELGVLGAVTDRKLPGKQAF